MLAFVGFVAASCSEGENSVSEETTVSITITTPDLQTRYGEGFEATELHWEVYVGDEHLVGLDGTKSFSGETTVELRLVADKTYSLLFWAVSPDQDIYTIADRKLTIDASKLKANQEAYDAFYAYEKTFVATKNAPTIELRRPFAQLNIATADVVSSSTAGVSVSKTGVEFDAYTVLNLVDGKVSQKKTLIYDTEDCATGLVTLAGDTYQMLSMNYLLVNEKELTNVRMTAINAGETITRDYSLVPFERNHRTYIVGNLLTTSVGIKVIIMPGFDDPTHIEDGE
jgi:hypothetical protein